MLQLRRKQELEQQFLLLSFVKYQYYIRNDNLVDRLIAIMQSTKNTLLRHQKDFHFENEPKQRGLLQALEDSNLSILNEVNGIINDAKWSDQHKIAALRSLVATKMQSIKILLEEKSSIETENLDKFDFIQKASQSLQGKLSGVVKLLEFDEKSSNSSTQQKMLEELKVKYPLKKNPLNTKSFRGQQSNKHKEYVKYITFFNL